MSDTGDSRKRFDAFMPFILKWECVRNRRGEVVAENDPDDPGGVTKYGIDARSHPGVDVAKLTLEQSTAIYWGEWVKAQAGTLPVGLGEVFFNACVNCGTSRAHKLFSDPAHPHTAAGFLDAQDGFYRRLVEQRQDLRKFLKGWLNRTADLRRFVGKA